MSAAQDLVKMLRLSRMSEARPVHVWHCPCTRIGKKYGPCNCPAGPLDEAITKIYQRLGLACKSCGAYKARRGSGHFGRCRYSFDYRPKAKAAQRSR